jgi:hypothetical protein
LTKHGTNTPRQANFANQDAELQLKKNQQIQDAYSKLHLGAFPAAPKTGLCGGSAACAADGHLWWPRPSNPLRSSTSGKPEVSYIQAWSFAQQNSGSHCRNAVV